MVIDQDNPRVFGVGSVYQRDDDTVKNPVLTPEDLRIVPPVSLTFCYRLVVSRSCQTRKGEDVLVGLK